MSSSTETGRTKDPEELRQEAAATRADLAQTVDALVAKTDVKGRAQDKAGELSAQARDKARQTRAGTQRRATQFTDTARENPVPVAVAGAAVLVGAVVVARRYGGSR